MAANSTMLELGTAAPDFELPDPTGTHWSRQQFEGAPALLVAFICNHCPYVKHLGRELGLLTQRWAARGVAVVGINSNDVDAYPDDAPDKMLDTARQIRLGLPLSDRRHPSDSPGLPSGVHAGLLPVRR